MHLLLFFLLSCCFNSPITAQPPMDTATANRYVQAAQQQQQMQQYVASTQQFQAAARLYQQHASWSAYFDCQNQIVRNYWSQQLLDSAFQLNQRIFQDSHLEKQSLQQAEAFSNMGVIYDMRSNSKKALKYYHQCLDIRKKKLGSNHIETGKIYSNIGAAYSYLGEWNTSVDFFQNAARNFKKNLGDSHPYLIRIKKNISAAYNELKQFPKARIAIEEAFSIAKKIYPKRHPFTIEIQIAMAAVYNQIPSKADDALQLAQELSIIIGQQFGKQDKRYINNITNLGTMYLRRKNFPLAKELLLESLAGCLERYGTKSLLTFNTYQKLAFLHEQQQQDSLALLYFHASALTQLPTISDTTTVNFFLEYNEVPISNLLNLISIHFYKIRVCQRFMVTTKTNDDFYHQLYVHLLKTASQLIQRTKQELYDLDDQVRILEYTAHFLKHESDYLLWLKEKSSHSELEEVVLNADQSKSILLQTALTSNNALQFGQIPDSLLQKTIALKTALAQLERNLFLAKQKKTNQSIDALEEQLFVLKEQQKNLQQAIENDYPKYYALKYNTAYPSIQQIQTELLDDSTMLLNYVLGDDYLYIYTITKKQVNVDGIKTGKVFKDKITSLRNALTNLKYIQDEPAKAFKDLSENSHYLYTQLIQKYVSKSIKNIILIPDKELARIPFEALLVSPPNNQYQHYNQLDFLVKHYNIRYAYSAALLLDAKKRARQLPNTSNQILGFAAAYAPEKSKHSLRASLAALPGAKQEVELLQNKFEGDFFIGNQANEAIFKQQNFSNYGVLHLAMHGMLNKKNPMNSCMAFTEDPLSKEDDWLYAHELTAMNIASNLVVLSACETGDGKHQKVEGIMSIGRSFMYAGAPSLIMTLWQVNDFATAQIMNFFYQQLAEGHSKSHALRQAKLHYLTLIEKKAPILSHPFFWGAFINLGDNSPILIQSKKETSTYYYGFFLIVFGLLGLMLKYFWPSITKNEATDIF